MRGSQKGSPQVALRRLARAYRDQVYLRGSPNRKAKPRTHRGYEVRLIAHSAAERDDIVALLRAAGENPGKPFVTGDCWRVPVYGQEAVKRLVAGMGVSAAAPKRKAARKGK